MGYQRPLKSKGMLLFVDNRSISKTKEKDNTRQIIAGCSRVIVEKNHTKRNHSYSTKNE